MSEYVNLVTSRPIITSYEVIIGQDSSISQFRTQLFRATRGAYAHNCSQRELMQVLFTPELPTIEEIEQCVKKILNGDETTIYNIMSQVRLMLWESEITEPNEVRVQIDNFGLVLTKPYDSQYAGGYEFTLYQHIGPIATLIGDRIWFHNLPYESWLRSTINHAWGKFLSKETARNLVEQMSLVQRLGP